MNKEENFTLLIIILLSIIYFNFVVSIIFLTSYFGTDFTYKSKSLINCSEIIFYKKVPKINEYINLIKKYEDLRLTKYELFGHYFIGYGHLITKNENYLQISKLDAEKILLTDLNKNINYFRNHTNLSKEKCEILGVLAYNVGIGTILNSNIIKDTANFDINYLNFNNINEKYNKKLHQRRINELLIYKK